MQATHEYHKLLERILREGTLKENRTGIDTVSIFNHTLELDMNQGFPLITTKKMYTKGIIGELLWFLTGSTDIRELWKANIKVWDGNWYDKYSKSCSSPYTLAEMKEKTEDTAMDPNVWDMGPVYGKQWVDWYTGNTKPIGWHHGAPETVPDNINQIQQVMDKLVNNPDDRRMMVSAWNIVDIPNMCLPPCHWAFELYTEELSYQDRYSMIDQAASDEYWTVDNITEESGHRLFDSHNIPKRRLSLKWHQRSVDTFLGLPFNIASYAFLLEMFAQQANMVPGKLIGDLTNVHLYENHLDLVKEQLERNPFKYKSPVLKVNNPGDMFKYNVLDFELEGYESYPNWKNVHMAV
jgi:thymidylate synthase